jgi:hypothetical protein
LRFELLAAGGGEAVVAGLAIIFGRTPEASDPAAGFEAVESRIEGPVFDLKNVF